MNKAYTLETIKEGMEIGEPVINNFGQTLLPSGLKISARHINLLKTWNIDKVFIVDKDSDENGENKQISEETKAYIEKQLSLRFNWIPENEFEKDIYQLTYISIAKEIKAI